MIRAYRIALAGWLLGWFCKAGYFVGALTGDAFTIPLAHHAFPGWLQSPVLALVAWLAPLAAIASLVWPRPALLRAAALVCLGSSLVCITHVATCSDATFVTSLWTGAWLVWLVWHPDGSDHALHARALAQLVLAVLFLGPALGKLTSEYVRGEAFYQLYIVQKPSWPYTWLREHAGEGTLRSLATWASRAIIGGELLLAGSVLLPFRLAAALGLVAMTTMVVISTPYLVSVLAAPAAMLIAAWTLRPD